MSANLLIDCNCVISLQTLDGGSSVAKGGAGGATAPPGALS